MPQDVAKAVAWYRKAAEQGFAKAQFNLAVRYTGGEGVPQDDGEAAAWYRRAAVQGFAKAQCNLGVMYLQGRGVPQDDAEAETWFRKAPNRVCPQRNTTLTSCRHRRRVRIRLVPGHVQAEEFPRGAWRACRPLPCQWPGCSEAPKSVGRSGGARFGFERPVPDTSGSGAHGQRKAWRLTL